MKKNFIITTLLSLLMVIVLLMSNIKLNNIKNQSTNLPVYYKYTDTTSKEDDLTISTYVEFGGDNLKSDQKLEVNSSGSIRSTSSNDKNQYTAINIRTYAKNINLTKNGGGGQFHINHPISGKANSFYFEDFFKDNNPETINDVDGVWIITINYYAKYKIEITGLNEGDTLTKNSVYIYVYKYDTSAGYYREKLNEYSYTTDGSYTFNEYCYNFSFTIDKTAPTILYSTNNIKYDTFNNIFNIYSENSNVGWINEDVYIQTSDKNGISTQKLFKKSSYFSTDNFLEISFTNHITDEGYYYYQITDKAGNIQSDYFVIDKTAPIAPSINEYINYDYQLSLFDTDIATVKYSFNNSEYQEIPQNYTFTNEGKYSVILTDKAGNSTTFSFTIDKTPPTATINTLNNYNFSNKNITIKFNEAGCTASYKLNDNEKNQYQENDILSEEGKYIFTITDKAGNSTNYEFIIDKTAPTYSVFDINNQQLEIKSGYNVGIYFTFDDANKEYGLDAKLNNQDYFGSIVESSNNYKLTITDKAGNSTTFNFQLIYKPFTDNLKYFQINLKDTKLFWYQTYKTAYSSYSGFTNTNISFANKEDAISYATYRENSFISNETYLGQKIYVSKYSMYATFLDPENATYGSNCFIYIINKKAYAIFNKAILDQYVNKNISESISLINYYDDYNSFYTGDDLIPSQISNELYFYTNKNIVFPYSQPGSLFINDKLVDYNYIISTNGIYQIKEIDIANNIIEYTIVFDNVGAKLKTENLEINEYLDTYKYLYLSKDIVFSVKDNITQYYIIYIYFNDNLINKITDLSSFKLDYSLKGEYKILIYDFIKNKSEYSIFVNPENIKVNSSISNNDITFTFLNKTYNQILGLKVLYFNTSTNTWEQLLVDSKNNNITASVYNLVFTNEGNYKFIILDAYGRITEENIDYIKKSSSVTTPNNRKTYKFSGSKIAIILSTITIVITVSTIITIVCIKNKVKNIK